MRRALDERSLVVFDKGANDKRNLDTLLYDHNDFLTSKKLNASDDKVFSSFSEDAWERIDAEDGINALKRTFPSRVDYYFFSEKLKEGHLASRRRKAERLLAEARMIQESLDEGRRLPKRFRINNPLVDVRYDYQTKLASMDEQEALRLLLDEVIDGREGCFCLVSSRDMPAAGCAAHLPQQGRHREALPLAEERDRGETVASMVGGRRVRRPPDFFHRSIDDKFDTISRRSSSERVNEIHHQLATKVDSYASSDRGRSRETVLFQLRTVERGCSSLIHGSNVIFTAPGTASRGGLNGPVKFQNA